MPIDILGDGFVVAPPSMGAKGQYQLVEGTLDDLGSLPTLRGVKSYPNKKHNTLPPFFSPNGCNDWRHGWKKHGWKRGKKELANADLWQAIDAVLSGADRVTIAWVKGHAGVEGNERADELATMGRDLVRGEPELSAIEQQLQYVV